MKEFNKGIITKLVAGLLVTLVLSYLIAAALKSIHELTNFQANAFEILSTIKYTINSESSNKVLLLVVTPIIYIFLLSKMGIYKKKYQDASDFGVHGTSRFGTVKELIKSSAISTNNKISQKDPMFSLDVEEGIILGKVPNKNELIIMPKDTSIDNRNVLVIGSSGSGKGQGFVFPNIVNNTSSTMIVTDPKGEIFNATSQLKKDQGYKVFQIDFYNLDQAHYNPLDYVKDDLDAQKIANTISRNSSKDGKEDFFFNTARDLLTGLIIYCKSHNQNANIPIDVKTEFYKASEDENYLKEVCETIGFNHPAYSYLKDASVAGGNTRTSILSSFAQQTSIFSLQKVAKMTTSSDFNFHDFQKEKSILYVKIPMTQNPVEALTATFFDQLINILYDIANENSGKLPIPTFLLLDEFANLGKINNYDGTLSTCRGLGIAITTVIQDFGQLEGKYGKENARTIRSNHDTHLFLATKDTETAKYYSELAGDTTVRMKTSSSSNPTGIFSKGNSSSSSQEQFVKKPLIPSGELTIKSKIDCYLFITNQYPIKLEKAYQYVMYGDFLFKGKDNVNYHAYRSKYMKHFNLIDENEIQTKLDSDELEIAFDSKDESPETKTDGGSFENSFSTYKENNDIDLSKQEKEDFSGNKGIHEYEEEAPIKEDILTSEEESNKDGGLLSFEDEPINDELLSFEDEPIKNDSTLKNGEQIDLQDTNYSNELADIVNNFGFDPVNVLAAKEDIKEIEDNLFILEHMDEVLAFKENEDFLSEELKDDMDIMN